MTLHSKTYALARILNNAHAIANPRRLPNRAKNIILGRLLSRAGAWRKLWR